MTPTVSRRKRQRVSIPRLPVSDKKQPPRDQHLFYRAFTQELADEIGFHEQEVYECWQEIACLLEYEQGTPRRVAEYMAMQMTRSMLEKFGPGEPS